MADTEIRDQASLLISVVLILALFCVGWWIDSYVLTGGRPWSVIWWFMIAAVAILAVGSVIILGRRNRSGKG